jgi:hypothetical protein
MNSGALKDFNFDLYNSSSLTLKVDSIIYNKEKISLGQLEFPLIINSNTSKTLNATYSSTILGEFQDTITVSP